MPNFPTSIDTMTNPDATKYLDSSGFELDVLISRLQDIATALETKVGYGGTTQTPVANYVLSSPGAGTSVWALVTTLNLAANAVSQRWYSTPSGTTTQAPATWATMHTNTQTFGGGDVRLEAHLNLSNGTACNVLIGVQVDSGTAVQVSAVNVPANLNTPVSVGYDLGTLSGSHAVKLVWNTSAGTIQTGTGCIMILEELKK